MININTRAHAHKRSWSYAWLLFTRLRIEHAYKYIKYAQVERELNVHDMNMHVMCMRIIIPSAHTNWNYLMLQSEAAALK